MSFQKGRAATLRLAVALALLSSAAPELGLAQAEAPPELAPAATGEEAGALLPAANTEDTPVPAAVAEAPEPPVPPATQAPASEVPPAPAAVVRPDEALFQSLEEPLAALRSGSADVEEPVRSARAAARERGVRNLDAAARALVLARDPGSGAPQLQAAAAAVALAPDLPIARMALSRALWDSGQRFDAVRTAGAAVALLDRHLEASLWLRATASNALMLGLFAGGILFLGVAAALQAPRATHDLGDALAREAPSFARAALLGTALLLPAALGEGLLGLTLSCFGLCFCYGGGRERIAAALAAAAVLAAVHPMAERTGAFVAAFVNDPLAQATFAVEEGVAAPYEVARLDRAADSDPLAARALALNAMREGRLAEADARYSVLRELAPADPLVANNAAKLRLALGDTRGGIELLERAASQLDSPVVLFNLSHAYGRAIRIDDQHRALERAQALDEDLVGDITQMQATRPGGFAMALPTPLELLRARLVGAGAGPGVTGALRERLAPGLLGASPLTAAAGFVLVALAVWLAAQRFRAGGACARCGLRLCPRCDGVDARLELCTGCARLLHRPETTDPTLRMERLATLRLRKERLDRVKLAASLAMPGAAGLLARRPFVGLAGALLGGSALVCLSGLREIVPDPLAAGPAGSLAFALAGALLALSHLLLALRVVLRGRRA